MSLASLKISGLRCLTEATLEFGPGLNLIHGPNGSGKTSILEAAFLIGRGRSFRTRHTDQLIARDKPQLALFARTIDPPHRIGFEYRRGETYKARLDAEDVRSLAELPAAFFVEAIDPEIHRLVEGSPSERRSWLDWGVFHVEPSFLEHWLRFSRALRQRNAALRAGGDPRAWDPELVQYGQQVATQRNHWFESLKPFLDRTIHQLTELSVDSSYFQGWAAEHSLSDALRDGLERDRTRGSTVVGPHRGDVHLRMEGRAAKETLSRGQQKLVAAAMVLALLQCLQGRGVSPPTLLLDDPAAELDGLRLRGFVELVKELNCQLIVTSLDPSQELFGHSDHVFHVERGSVQRL